MKLLAFLAILWSFPVFSYTYTNSVGAGFDKDRVKIYVTSNSDCDEANITTDDILKYARIAVDSYWNKVTTSRLKIEIGGRLKTTDNDYLDGKLCNPNGDDNCDSEVVPLSSDIVIACNYNATNFPSSAIYAVTLNNNISTKKIKGSVILINDRAGSAFKNLNKNQIIAVLAHEIGHAIGLGHTANNANIMYYTLTPKRTSLGQGDIDGVSSLYPQEFDGCGLVGSIAAAHDHGNDDHDGNGSNFFVSLILGIFLVSIFRVGFQKISFKFSKPIV